MTALAEPNTKKPQTVRFSAPGIGLRLVVEPQEERYHPTTGKLSAVRNTGKTIEFQPDGRGGQIFETSDPAEIEWLRAHPQFERRQYIEEPVAKPPSSPVLSEIAQLAARRDVDGLVEVYEREQAGDAREDILETITASLSAIEQTEQPAPAPAGAPRSSADLPPGMAGPA